MHTSSHMFMHSLYTCLYTCLHPCLQYMHVDMHTPISMHMHKANTHVCKYLHAHVCSICCAYACSAYAQCVHMHVHAHTRACTDACARARARTRTRALMRARTHSCTYARAHAQACDALHPYNVQGRAQATHKDVRELVPSWVPKALVRWHVTGQSRHTRDTAHPAGCRRPTVAPCDAVGTGFRAGKWPKNY